MNVKLYAAAALALASAFAHADDTKLIGPLASGSYNPHGRTWLQTSATTRDQVTNDFATAQARPKMPGPLASGSYNPFGRDAMQNTSMTRDQVRTELAAAQARPKLPGPLASGSYNPFGRELTPAPVSAKPIVAGTNAPGKDS
ncbi:MAG: hypothetical protein JSR59_17315 [Proteobacteria bacterium]|nr:hypothetical protein [Pseudomonadota bacterium]